MKNFITAIVVLFLISCGSYVDEGLNLTGETGSIKATIANSKSFNPNISHGQIKKYIVTISADDITESIIKEFEGDAESGVIDGIPVGKKRVIRVEAINQNKSKIKEGESYDIEIVPAEVAEVQVDLVAVPIFANLGDGNTIPNTRFKAVIFNDGSDPIEILDDFGNTELPVMDINSMLTEIVVDLSTGLATFLPQLLPSGEHKLTARNLKTGKHTTITVRLVDGTKIIPAPLFGGVSDQPATLNIGLVN